MPGIIIKPRARVFHGHDWVYSSEIKKTFGDPKPGDVISLKDYKDRSLGTAIYNPKSQIVARRFSRRKQDLNSDFAESLKEYIKSELENGKTKDEIFSSLVEKYGQWILYDPGISRNTLLLWTLPLLLFLVGGAIIVNRILKKKYG